MSNLSLALHASVKDYGFVKTRAAIQAMYEQANNVEVEREAWQAMRILRVMAWRAHLNPSNYVLQ